MSRSKSLRHWTLALSASVVALLVLVTVACVLSHRIKAGLSGTCCNRLKTSPVDVASRRATKPLGMESEVLCEDSNERPMSAVNAKERNFADEIRQLTGTNNIPGGGLSEASGLFQDIAKSFDKDIALRYFEDAMDVAMEQTLVGPTYRKVRLPGKLNPQGNAIEVKYGLEPDYYYREGHLRRLWNVTHFAFLRAQSMRSNNYEGWERLFAFYGKCTDEIVSMGKAALDPPFTGLTGWRARTEEYVRFVRSELKQYIHVMRYFEVERPDGLAANLTESQRTDLLRRFAEVEEFTRMPSEHPGNSGLND